MQHSHVLRAASPLSQVRNVMPHHQQSAAGREGRHSPAQYSVKLSFAKLQVCDEHKLERTYLGLIAADVCAHPVDGHALVFGEAAAHVQRLARPGEG